MVSERVKYPRTPHVSWSESATSDDVWLIDSATIFDKKEIVALEKVDGENTTVYPDGHVHARSLDTSHHSSRSWVKKFAGQFAHDIPKGFRICGENVYAYHSIFYTGLPSYFLVFSIYDGNTCLSWDETVSWCQLLGLDTVPVIYRGMWDAPAIKNLSRLSVYGAYEAIDPNKKDIHFPEDFKLCGAEGYVVRNASDFSYWQFAQNAAKWVRANHVKGNIFWMDREPLPNLLKNS